MSPDINVKLLKERNRFERPEPLQAVKDSQQWFLRCMHIGCPWPVGAREHFQTAEAAKELAQFHADGTGHPVKLSAIVEFDAGIIRSELGGR